MKHIDTSINTAVQAVEHLIHIARTKHASDIHIDPSESACTVRLRIDGKLQEYHSFSKQIYQDIVSRIKILSQLRTDEHQAPQDGRFKYTSDEKHHIDIRVSIIPSYFGESIVMRLLHDTVSAPSLTELGMSDDDQKKILRVISKSSGMILVTGPTGSGKTTTLYTLLKMLNTSERSIITIEDPIEYSIEGIRQIQTNPQRGLTFATGLRSLLRQDPDVIMVGEIRDAETAHIAIHTALTGHLLLSTVHTNDAAATIPRLMDMGIDPYLIASTISVVIGQRLIRKSCPDCTHGCEHCDGKGYVGRIGIFEVLTTHEEIVNAIMERATTQTIKTLAMKHGMKTLENDGLEKVMLGITKIEEVVAAIIE